MLKYKFLYQYNLHVGRLKQSFMKFLPVLSPERFVQVDKTQAAAARPSLFSVGSWTAVQHPIPLGGA